MAGDVPVSLSFEGASHEDFAVTNVETSSSHIACRSQCCDPRMIGISEVTGRSHHAVLSGIARFISSSVVPRAAALRRFC